MKVLSIIALLFFANFLTLPTVALVMDWDIAVVSAQNMSEEETQNTAEEEKQHSTHHFSIPQSAATSAKKADFVYTDRCVIEHYLTIFSPPPEA
ncbi:MAG: hypothetical protein Q4G08_11465 [Capnocytophaga sp.]|nr:hypothetical protein [Capnocytophaga sp.]